MDIPPAPVSPSYYITGAQLGPRWQSREDLLILTYLHTKAFLHKVGHGVEYAWEQVEEEASHKQHLFTCLPKLRKSRRTLSHLFFYDVVW